MTTMLILTVIAFIVIVGSCVLYWRSQNLGAGDLRSMIGGNGFGCGIILWAVLAFWAWVAFVVLHYLMKTW